MTKLPIDHEEHRRRVDYMSDYENLKPALKELVDAGTLSAAQALAAQQALMSQVGTVSVGENRSRRSLFSEALTYIGGAVIVVSAGLLLSQAWEQLGTWGRPAVIGGASIALFIAAFLLSKDLTVDTIRRLCSTLFVGSAALMAFTIGLITNEFWIPKNDPGEIYWVNPKPWVYMTIALLCAVGAGLISWFGYQRAKSAFCILAQILATDIALFAVGALIWIQIYGDRDFPSYGSLVLLVLGGVWIYLAEKEKFIEVNAVAFGGMFTLLFAIQTLREQLPDWATPIAMILGGFGLLGLYLNGRRWAFLVGGIGGTLIGGIELLTRYVEGVAGALGSMLLGIALLVLGTRLFKERN